MLLQVAEVAAFWLRGPLAAAIFGICGLCLMAKQVPQEICLDSMGYKDRNQKCSANMLIVGVKGDLGGCTEPAQSAATAATAPASSRHPK